MGPEASLSLMLGHLIDDLVYGDPHSIPANPELEAAAIAVIATFQVGLITSILGLLRLGFLDVVLSRALLRGFITAIGVVCLSLGCADLRSSSSSSLSSCSDCRMSSMATRTLPLCLSHD